MQKYDFYTSGISDAEFFTASETEKKAMQIEKEYGEQARLEYEMGILMAIPTTPSKNNEYHQEVVDSINKGYRAGGNSLYGAENLRNNSYFGYNGTSEQYNKNGNYNPPHRTK